MQNWDNDDVDVDVDVDDGDDEGIPFENTWNSTEC